MDKYIFWICNGDKQPYLHHRSKSFRFYSYIFKCKREHHNKESTNILAQEAAELIGLAIQNFLSSEPSIVPSDEVSWTPLSRLIVIGLFIVLPSHNYAHHIRNCTGTIHTRGMAGWITRGSLFNHQTKPEIQSCVARRKALRSAWSIGFDAVFGRVFQQDHRLMKPLLEEIYVFGFTFAILKRVFGRFRF